MRADYGLYGVAIICFIIAIVFGAEAVPGYTFEEAYVTTVAVTVVFTILGIISAVVGYSTRPKAIMPTTQPIPVLTAPEPEPEMPPSPPPSPPPPLEEVALEPSPPPPSPPVEPSPPAVTVSTEPEQPVAVTEEEKPKPARRRRKKAQ